MQAGEGGVDGLRRHAGCLRLAREGGEETLEAAAAWRGLRRLGDQGEREEQDNFASHGRTITQVCQAGATPSYWE